MNNDEKVTQQTFLQSRKEVKDVFFSFLAPIVDNYKIIQNYFAVQ